MTPRDELGWRDDGFWRPFDLGRIAEDPANREKQPGKPKNDADE
jgi:hypothetical protein